MSERATPIAHVGIIGGGQLGRMLARAASELGCETTVLDPHPRAPAAHVADHHVVGGYDDPDRLREVVTACDVSTYDLDGIAIAPLRALADEGHTLLPHPDVLATVQDKLTQKEALAAAGLPVAAWEPLDTPTWAAVRARGLPVVQKARRGGYDGRGVVVLERDEDVGALLPVPSLLEDFVPCDKELGVMVARGIDGALATYPVTEMVFKKGANVLEGLLAPARIPDEVAARARRLAEDAVIALGGVGIFGVEFFSTREGALFVNEVSPRTHNSGHYTVEACVTDQFAQHLRAILGLPLGSPEQLRPAAMVNLLGAQGAAGPPVVVGLDEALALPGVAVHLYGKSETRPGRKMGHATVLAPTLEEAHARAGQVGAVLSITARPSEGVR